jgi:hypothetical protein
MPNELQTERAEVRWTNSNSTYLLAHHIAPYIIDITHDYTASTNGKRTLIFECLHCGLGYAVSAENIGYRSLGVLEPDLLTPAMETEF